jgi:hypothetical protein
MLQSREKNCMQPTANKNTVKPVQLGFVVDTEPLTITINQIGTDSC